ncbi:MAG: HlyD family secretion protein [Pseudomonadota bacterium]|jgi:multidrug resistance efflux pump
MQRRHTPGDVSVRIARLAPPVLLVATLATTLGSLSLGPVPTSPAWVQAPAVHVYAPEDGIVTDVHVGAGETLEAGRPLLTLQAASLTGARARLEAERAEAELSANQWRAEQAQRIGAAQLSLAQPIARADADATTAEAEASAAQRSLATALARMDAGLGGAEDVTRWQQEVASRRAEAEAARRLAASLRAQAPTVTRPDGGGLDADATVAALSAELAALDARLAALVPTAPSAGRVEDVRSVRGAYVRAGDELLRLRPAESTRVLACGPLRTAAPAPGTAVEATSDAGSLVLTVVDVEPVASHGEGRCPADRPMRRVVLAAPTPLPEGAVLAVRWPTGTP